MITYLLAQIVSWFAIYMVLSLALSLAIIYIIYPRDRVSTLDDGNT